MNGHALLTGSSIDWLRKFPSSACGWSPIHAGSLSIKHTPPCMWISCAWLVGYFDAWAATAAVCAHNLQKKKKIITKGAGRRWRLPLGVSKRVPWIGDGAVYSVSELAAKVYRVQAGKVRWRGDPSSQVPLSHYLRIFSANMWTPDFWAVSWVFWGKTWLSLKGNS